jgi:hypothetical protein
MRGVPALAPSPMEFAPPSNYAFEPELTGPTPRPLQDNLNDGPYARETRTQLSRVFAVGLTCFVLPYVPGVQTLSYYLLPLAYLDWIGLAALVIAAGRTLHYVLRRGPFRYVKDGQPFVARVMTLALEPSPIGHGAARFKATLIYQHPETGVVTQSATTTKDLSTLQQARYAPRFQVGDYVTAVYLPGKNVEKSLRLYAFLDLSPDVNIRAIASTSSTLRTALVAIGVVALLFVLLGNVYAMERYSISNASLRGLGIAAAVGAVVLAALAAVLTRFESTPTGRRSLTVGTVASALLIGAMSGMCWSLALNAWLDRSPAREHPAIVVQFWTKTYDFLFRSYEIEYRLDERLETTRLLTTLEHIHQFHGPHAVARIRQGAFGWTWIESLEPVPDPPDGRSGGNTSARPHSNKTTN